MILRLDRVSAKWLREASAELGPGLWVIQGTPPDGADELVALLDGTVRPRHGRTLLDGHRIDNDPQTRSKIASLHAQECLVPAGSVASALTAMAVFRTMSGAALDWLERIGSAHLADRSPQALSPGELRCAALALALGLSDPALVVLYEPEVVDIGVPWESIWTRLFAISKTAPVLCVTGSPETATRLGGPHVVLNGGIWSPPADTLGVPGRLRIQGARLRRVVAELAVHPAVTSLQFSGRSPDIEELVVQTADATELSRHVISSAANSEARIWSLAVREGDP